MAKLIKKVTPFTQVPNHLINDTNLSAIGKIVYIYFKSKPDNWNFTTIGTASQLKESEKTVRQAIKELLYFGWLTRTGTQYTKYEYTLHDNIQIIKPPVKSTDGQIYRRSNLPTVKSTGHSNTIEISNTKKESNTLKKINNNNKPIQEISLKTKKNLSLKEKINVIISDVEYMSLIKKTFSQKLITQTEISFHERVILHGSENKTISELKNYFTNILNKETKKLLLGTSPGTTTKTYFSNFKNQPYKIVKNVKTGIQKELTKEQFHNKKYNKLFNDSTIWEIIQ